VDNDALVYRFPLRLLCRWGIANVKFTMNTGLRVMTVVLAIFVTTGLATLIYVSIKSHLDVLDSEN
jgi:hypothetical protein